MINFTCKTNPPEAVPAKVACPEGSKNALSGTSSFLPGTISYNKHCEPSHQLFIGGLLNETSLAELQVYLRSLVGSHSWLTVRLMQRVKRGTFSGYGIIRNLSSAEKNFLLSLKKIRFQGTLLGMQEFLKKRSEISKIQQERDSRTVFLNGLKGILKERDLERHFSTFGEVNHIQISTYLESKRYKGFGFVEFAGSESVEKVLSRPHHMINGIEVRCEQSKSTSTGCQSKSKIPAALDTKTSHHQQKAEQKNHKQKNKPNQPSRLREGQDGSTLSFREALKSSADGVNSNHYLHNIMLRPSYPVLKSVSPAGCSQ